MDQPQYTAFDRLIVAFDQKLSALAKPVNRQPRRPSPAHTVEPTVLNDAERRCSGRLMRVNHTGEVSAQALYQGQALTSHSPGVLKTMKQSADEEIDHLTWCEQRIKELGGRTSYLNPFWYFGSLALGAIAGITGDKWSLGFVAETERQVVLHLQDHLTRIPPGDLKSRLIIQQMMSDEAHHETVALESGGVELPALIKIAMRISSRLMTKTTYWV